jgi:hypothetical protein
MLSTFDSDVSIPNLLQYRKRRPASVNSLSSRGICLTSMFMAHDNAKLDEVEHSLQMGRLARRGDGRLDEPYQS